MASEASSTPLTIGRIAAQLGVRAWQVRRLYERGFLPPAARIGVYRVIPAEDIPAVEEALRRAGYLANEDNLPAPHQEVQA